MNSKDLRTRMKRYREQELNPSMRLIALAVDMNYNYFTEWQKGTKDIADDRLLVNIDTFLKSKGY